MKKSNKNWARNRPWPNKGKKIQRYWAWPIQQTKWTGLISNKDVFKSSQSLPCQIAYVA